MEDYKHLTEGQIKFLALTGLNVLIGGSFVACVYILQYENWGFSQALTIFLLFSLATNPLVGWLD